MNQQIQFRNFQSLTTGDFDAFEFFAGGEWKRGQISRTALDQLAAGRGLTLEAILSENRDRILKALVDLPYNDGRQAYLITSGDLGLG